jgi:hypothetical protein
MTQELGGHAQFNNSGKNVWIFVLAKQWQFLISGPRRNPKWIDPHGSKGETYDALVAETEGFGKGAPGTTSSDVDSRGPLPGDLAARSGSISEDG